MEIYYVEDDKSIAEPVRGYLEERGFQVTILGTFLEARQRLEKRVPAMVLLDWNMPDGQGDRMCQWIRSKFPELPVIFLTVRGDSRDVITGFYSGADDYVTKPFELEVLYSRIRALLRRTKGFKERYLSCGGILLDRERRTVHCDSREVALSASEYQLLACLMENMGRTVTREKILEQVWDVNGNYVNDNTLTVTMKRLRDKLHQPSCLKTVRSVGYRMEEET
ncbi:MAG TPA: response regulator transcription factor [Candidatus Limivivens merdigallinarum]|uniref:Stage 0 sporulation protein A homolog n=1 Tax=Candidatus Limivivens merdigallinarum TaxID=2840859 RepID=A0A9D1D0P8_9FIRM|nr:response regulator transcription factor [Candidatus Limivivens merdigallinarum]